MAISKKKKPTNKDMVRTINAMGMEIQMLRMEIENAKKVQDMYMFPKKKRIELKFKQLLKMQIKKQEKNV